MRIQIGYVLLLIVLWFLAGFTVCWTLDRHVAESSKAGVAVDGVPSAIQEQ